ncbi:MAG: SDR family NAD(P)-dependent oxidoreductase [Candidatus Daviesbacteria bacterium]|nr:SDR family NAD(P)-dependent oxidoreductase [Candidatus Daviesbacteria bacterium]
MKKILITGASSGIGRELSKDLCLQDYSVIGIARRKKLLNSLKKELSRKNNFSCIEADLSQKNAWEKIILTLKRKKFIPDIVVFNAATWDKKLIAEYSYEDLEKAHQVNFLSVMKGISLLLPYCKKRRTQFIAISTLSSFWGSPVEGIGYPASKAALSIAFEGFYQKFKHTNFKFTTVSFGPIKVEANSFRLFSPFQLPLNSTVEIIEKAIKEKKAAYFAPTLVFFCFNLLRLLPSTLRLPIFAFINSLHPYNLHKK